jgi:hypothetical protein
MLTDSDVIALQQVLALYAHAADAPLDRRRSLLAQVFTEDATFDSRQMQAGIHRGLDGIESYFSRVNPPHTPAHTTTNVYIHEEAGQVLVWSKWTIILRGSVAMGDYRDVVANTPNGWRIKTRVAVGRLVPPSTKRS